MTPIIVIAIDGPSASGKGTLARRLAEHLGYDHLDTGALYRAVGKAVLDAGNDPNNEEDALSAAQALSSTLDPVQLADPSLRTDDVGQAASKVARFAGVRQALLDFQRDFASRPRIESLSKGVILDGRDIGTVICPTAHAKLFVTASTEERARRRHLELVSKGLDVPYETVLKDMYERDTRDSGRDTAPLKPATDALILDTTDLNADQAMEKSLAFIQVKISTIDP